ncbi:MAG: trypsin-like serine protease [Bacteriovorax sp.]|jgi:secreted trypsin-like serine protease
MKSIAFVFLFSVMVSCGKTNEALNNKFISSKVFGGHKIDLSNPLAQVTVGISNKKLNAVCTGTIIAENIILTAAHCIEKAEASDMTVLFGQSLYSTRAKTVQIESMIAHKNFVHSSIIRNDLALLKIQGKILEGYKVLDIDSSLNLEFNPGRTVLVAGFGFSRIDFMKMGLGTLRAAEVKMEHYSPNEDLLILDQSENKGICQGDSGGGAFVLINGELVQLGVTSFVYLKGNDSKRADCRNKAFFTNVSFFNSWIKDAMAAL